MFLYEISKLKNDLLEYFNIIKDMFLWTTKLTEINKEELAKNINSRESQCNHYEVKIEENCIYAISQYAPKAQDLRLIITILYINNFLERIGDHIVNISESELFLYNNSTIILPDFLGEELEKMFSYTQQMLEESINAFIDKDSNKAHKICVKDKEINSLKKNLYQKLISKTIESPNLIEYILHIERIINNLERIADLTTNLCEEIIFLYEGKIIKHHREETL